MVKQVKSLEKENARLKKLVAEQALDMEILKEAAKGNWPRFWVKGPNGDKRRLWKFVEVWGLRKFRSVVSVRFLVNRGARSVT